MPEIEIAKGVQLLDLMLDFFADDGRWARGWLSHSAPNASPRSFFGRGVRMRARTSRVRTLRDVNAKPDCLSADPPAKDQIPHCSPHLRARGASCSRSLDSALDEGVT